MNDVGVHALWVIRYWTDPWSSFLHKKTWPKVQYAQMVRRHKDMKRDVLNVITQQPKNTFAVFHYPLPHNPYLFDEDGEFCGPDKIVYEYGNVEGYERNLAALDRFIGEVVAAMKRAGRFDDALIILTSDHTFRYDPQREAGHITCPLTHVPLIIKTPGQRRALALRSRFENRDLGALIIDKALAAGSPLEDIERLLKPGAAVAAAADGAAARAVRAGPVR